MTPKWHRTTASTKVCHVCNWVSLGPPPPREQCWFWNFRKQIIKNHQLKLTKIPKVFFVKTIEKKIQEKFAAICMGSSSLNIWLPLSSMLTKKKLLKVYFATTQKCKTFCEEHWEANSGEVWLKKKYNCGRNSALKMAFSEKSQVHEWPRNDLEGYKGKGTQYI